MALTHKYDATVFANRTTDVADIHTAAIAAVTRLTAIITNIDSYTTPQLKDALKDVAQYERALIKIVARMV